MGLLDDKVAHGDQLGSVGLDYRAAMMAGNTATTDDADFDTGFLHGAFPAV
jgi:hypothetical protein